MDFIVHPEESSKLTSIKLPNPQTNQLQDYLYDEENLTLSEIVKHFDPTRSWFFDNSVCIDGELYMITKIDPLFILLPFIMEYSATSFRTLQDICSSAENLTNDLYFALSPSINWNHVCDTKELDQELYVRYNEDKTLDWLVSKSNKLLDALIKVSTHNTSRFSLTSYAYDLVSEYIPHALVEKFKTRARKNFKN